MQEVKIELECAECKHPHTLTLNPWTGKHKWKAKPIATYGELWELVAHYKMLKGYDKIVTWDQQHKPRSLKAAKRILKFFAAVKDPIPVAKECMADIHERAEQQGWNWTLETVVKMAPDWLIGKQKASSRGKS